jgi:hypothetical protein
MSFLSANDLVFYKDPENNNHIKSMGFNIESILLNKSINNSNNSNNSSNSNDTDPNKNKISSQFRDLMIPSGLAFEKMENTNTSTSDNSDDTVNTDEDILFGGSSSSYKYDDNDNDTIFDFINNTKIIGEDIFSKLVGLVEIEPTVVSKQTRRNHVVKNGNKTKKNGV